MPTPPSSSNVLFADDFKGTSLPWDRTEHGGYLAEVSGGLLRIFTTGFGHIGWVETRPITIDPKRVLVIERRTWIHPANPYLDAQLSVEIVGYPWKRFGVSYSDYRYGGKGEESTIGISLFRRDANSHYFVDRTKNTSPLIPPIWNRWFDEELRYSPQSGELHYSIDGTERLVLDDDPLPPGATAVAVGMRTWGWYKGHEQRVIRLTVAQ